MTATVDNTVLCYGRGNFVGRSLDLPRSSQHKHTGARSEFMKARNFSALTILLMGVFLLASSTLASAHGTNINGTLVWDGVTRYYHVYLPTGLPANPPMLVMLHATNLNPGDNPPTKLNYGWQTLADTNKFIVVQPASTYDPQSGQWNWNAYYLDPAFPGPPPDDSGFLRQLITNLMTQYNVDPKRVFVAGMSSGAMMAERVGVELSDLVAAITPVSGQIAGQPTLPITMPGTPMAPVSVQEWHGTADRVLPPCNHGSTLYSGYKVLMATVDETFNYWVAQNACTQLQTSQPLCANGKPNPGVSGNDGTSCMNNVEVQFIWEQKLGHSWESSNNAARWKFFASHPKQ